MFNSDRPLSYSEARNLTALAEPGYGFGIVYPRLRNVVCRQERQLQGLRAATG